MGIRNVIFWKVLMGNNFLALTAWFVILKLLWKAYLKHPTQPSHCQLSISIISLIQFAWKFPHDPILFLGDHSDPLAMMMIWQYD